MTSSTGVLTLADGNKVAYTHAKISKTPAKNQEQLEYDRIVRENGLECAGYPIEVYRTECNNCGKGISTPDSSENSIRIWNSRNPKQGKPWWPIKTAPKTGILIDVFQDGERVCDVFYDDIDKLWRQLKTHAPVVPEFWMNSPLPPVKRVS